MKGRVGRADLLQAWVAGGEAVASDLARRLGMSEKPLEEASRDVEVEPHGVALDVQVMPVTVSTGEREQMPTIPMLKVTGHVTVGRPSDSDDPARAPLLPADLEPTGPEPTSPAAVGWTAVQATLDRLLARPVRLRALPVRRLIEDLARCRPIGARRTPVARRWPRELVLVMDRDDRLVPVWTDQDRVCARLRRRLGRSALLVERVGDAWSVPGNSSRCRGLSPAAPTLLLSGWPDLVDAQDRVERFTRREAGRGLRGRTIAVLSAGRVPGRRLVHTRTCILVPWDPRDGREATAWERFVTWVLERVLSVPVFFEAGLLREVRLALGVDSSGLGDEVTVWSGVEHRHSGGGTLSHERRSKLQEELTDALDPSIGLARVLSDDADMRAALASHGLPPIADMDHLLRQACAALFAVLARWRVAAAPVIRDEELFTFDACFAPGESPVDTDSLAQARLLIEQALATKDPGLAFHVRGWLARCRDRAHARIRSGERHEFLRDAWQVLGAHETTWVIHQERGGLQARRRSTAWRRIAVVKTSDGVLDLTSERGNRSIILREKRRVPWPHGPTTWATDFEQVQVEPFRREGWMSAWGAHEGERGFWVEVGERTERIRFHWRPPPAVSEAADGSQEGRFQVVESTLPSWAARAGIDEYGAWTDVEVKGQVQRMRWVPPGTFLMGSPAEEEGRYANESQHEVEITAGFWLGETPCTQAFYEVVTEASPSRFEGGRRPVERVPWDDVQQMLTSLERLVPGFEGRLPTEAEWEYACRAGATDAVYSLPLADIAWYSENSAHRSHDVGGKLPNPWGLRDMLGNVYEWCEDWLGDYPKGRAVDPHGPADGVLRVLRGGSWFRGARRCRAALRRGSPPGRRNGYIGFRLSRGQGFQSDRGGAREQGQAKPKAGRDARPRRGRASRRRR